MARRLYLTSATAPANPGYASVWEQTYTANRWKLGFEREGVGGSSSTTSETSTSTTWDFCMAQWVSEPFVRAGTVNTDDWMSICVNRSESNAAADFRVHLVVRVVDSSGTHKGTFYDTVSIVEFPTTLTAGVLAPGPALAAVSVVPGDRLVVEYGVRATNAVSTPYSGVIGRGGTEQTDLANGDVGQTGRSGWLEVPDSVFALWQSPFLPNDLADATISVDAAWGADLTADPDTWTWTDITSDVRADPGISTTLGRSDEASNSQPASCTMILDNGSGDYSLGGQSRLWPNIRRNTPIRVRVYLDGTLSTVFQGYANGFTPGWDSLNGNIPIVTLEASGSLRRLEQGTSPVPSPLRRALTVDPTVVAYWPFEEGEGATLAKNLRGGTDFSFSGTPDWASNSEFLGSDPLPVVKDGYFNASVLPYTSTGENQVTFLLDLPDDGLADGVVLAHVHTTGSLARFDITYEAGGGLLGMFIYARNGSLYDSVPEIGFQIDGQSSRIALSLTQSGSDVQWSLNAIEAVADALDGGYGETVVGQTCGIVSHIELMPHSDGGDAAIGHVAVANDVASLTGLLTPLIGYDGEYTSSSTPGIARLERVADENGLHLDRYTSVSGALTEYDRMGPMRSARLVELLRDVERVDQGQLWDGRGPGLAYTTRRYREQGTVALTIDASTGQLASEFAPVDDDQRTRNKVEVSRFRGVTAIYEDTDGPMGTSVIGTYDESVEVNLYHDVMAVQHAAWLVNLGTVEGYRYPSVTVDLRAAPELAEAVLAVVPGDRIEITNLSSVLSGLLIESASLIVEGVGQEISPANWRVRFACSLFSPWAVAQAAAMTGDTSEFVMRADTAGSELAAYVSQGDTTLSVSTLDGPLWTTDADDFPLEISLGGVPVTVTGISGPTSPQTFTVTGSDVVRAFPSGTSVKVYNPRPLGL